MPNLPVDSLPLEVAVEIAESIHAIPDAPRMRGAMVATARDLMEWCKGVPRTEAENRASIPVAFGLPAYLAWTSEQQARWLEAEARREFTTWPGPAGLRRLFDGKFRREKLFESEGRQHGFEPSGPPPEPKCKKCGDAGVFQPQPHQDIEQPEYDWCDCAQGSALRTEVPNYLRLCKVEATTRGIVGATITADAIRAIARQQFEKHRDGCPICAHVDPTNPTCDVGKTLKERAQ